MNVIEAYKAQRSGVAVYGGEEPIGYRVARTYRALRQSGVYASVALERARQSLKGLFPRHGSNIGAPFGNGLRWVERPEDVGLRFVGFADEVAPRRVDHTGWFTREDGYASGEMLRGAVYQLPARGGKARYVAGYQEIGFGGDGAVVAFGEIFEGERGGNEYRCDGGEDAARDAARRADRIADIMAEEARDWDAAWQAGAQWAGLGEVIQDARRATLAILKERRAVALPPAMCGAVRARVESLLEEIRDAREKRKELAAGYWERGAFNEGAGAAVL